MTCRFTLTQRVVSQGVKFPYTEAIGKRNAAGSRCLPFPSFLFLLGGARAGPRAHKDKAKGQKTGVSETLGEIAGPCSFSSFVSPCLALGLCWAFVPPPFPSLSVPLPPGAFFDCLFVRVFGLPCFASYTCIPGIFLVVCFSWLFVPLGLVPGLSGRRLVQDFQHRPFPPLFLFVLLARHLPSRSVICVCYIPHKDSSVVLLAVDWSGVSSHWTPKQYHFSTVSGRRLIMDLLGSKRNTTGLKLTPSEI